MVSVCISARHGSGKENTIVTRVTRQNTKRNAVNEQGKGDTNKEVRRDDDGIYISYGRRGYQDRR